MFKVGDWVVGLISETNEIFEVTDYVCKKKRNGDPAIVMCFKAKGRDDFCVAGLQVRHATPQEIAAGHRIDNDMGDDSHIENHVSPLCKQVKL
ncbi:hypothetical protein [Acinetobacter venetianus]|uniref:hypothetical protein n=1 Tax=Acinetobacter venetianus TaxID=52133 RepID=UPI002150011A|nr:hypothetical protein [Acinetobacter venetianus]MCR4532723.1 hypothetical protein [Acinetobacter venetianus]